MDDKSLLEALGQMMDVKLAQQKQEIMHEMKVLLDAEFTPKFNLLAENQDEILRQMPTDEDEELLDTRIAALEAVVRKHGRDIAALKKAN